MKRQVALAAATIAISAAALSACSSQSGLALAREACGRVHASIGFFEAGIHASNPQTTARDLKRAIIQLQAAEPLAADATSADGQWNALMTTLNEIGQVDERRLISALRAQCAVADSNQSALPNGPGPLPSTPGRNSKTSTTTEGASTTTG